MASEIKVDTISEKTSANGVTIDGVSLKDSKIATANSVDSDAYVDGSIDAVHLSANSVDSDSYVDGSIDAVHLSANSVDSDAYVDASIDTAHIGATQVTGAKLNTDVISAQTALTAEPADTDEFMVSDAGVLKRIDYSLIKGGGSLTHIKTLTASSSAFIGFINGTSDVVFDATYNYYKVFFAGVGSDTGSGSLLIQPYVSAAWSTFNRGMENFTRVDSGTDAVTVNNNLKTDGRVSGQGLSNDMNCEGELFLSYPATSAFKPVVGFTCWNLKEDDDLITSYGMHTHNTAVAYTGFRFIMNAGDITQGTFSLYGVTV